MLRVVPLLCLAWGACAAEFTWDDWVKQMEEPCTAYVKAQAKAGQSRAWEKKIDEKIKQKVADNAALNESSAFQAIILDWFNDHEGSLRSEDPESILEACLFFLRCIRTGTPPPPNMRNRLTRVSADELLDVLKKGMGK